MLFEQNIASNETRNQEPKYTKHKFKKNYTPMHIHTHPCTNSYTSSHLGTSTYTQVCTSYQKKNFGWNIPYCCSRSSITNLIQINYLYLFLSFNAWFEHKMSFNFCFINLFFKCFSRHLVAMKILAKCGAISKKELTLK